MTNETQVRRRAPRRDAQERREALIAAAAHIFAAEGYGAALESIADRAGVGRGTLYRNFRNRAALALAIFSREIDRLESVLDPALPFLNVMTRAIREGAAASALFTRIAVELHHDDPNLTAFRELGERLEAIVAPMVAQAQARGELDAALTSREVVLAMRMAGGVLQPFMNEEEAAAQLAAALRVLVDGLRPR